MCCRGLGLLLELGLGNTLAHGRSGSSLENSVQASIDKVGTRPFLVCQDITADLALLALHQLDVSLHTLLGESSSEQVRDVGVRVETTKSDELPDEAKLAEIPDVALHLLGAELSGIPIERWRQVVCEPLVRTSVLDTLSELLGLGKDGRLGLHPEQVGVRTESDGTVDGTVGTTLVSIVTLAGSAGIPVEADLDTKTLGLGLSLDERDADHLLAELVGLGLLALLLELGGDSITVADGLSLAEPLVLEGDELGTIGTLLLGTVENVDKGLEVGVGGTEDEGMVTLVDVGGDQGSSFRVGTGNDEVLDTHDVVLESDSNETVDVLLDRNKHLTSHVTTLLGTRSLVLNVDTSCTLLDKELGEFHDSGKTTVTSVGISNNGTEVVDEGNLGTLLGRHITSLLALLAIVEKLGHEEVLHLEGDSVVRVVGKIGTGLVGGRGGRRALPTGDVDGFEVLGHLGYLNRVKCTVGVRSGALGGMVLERLPELLGLGVRGVSLLESASFRYDLLGSVRAGGVGETRVLPPLLDGLDFFGKELEFLVSHLDLLSLDYDVGVWVYSVQERKKGVCS